MARIFGSQLRLIIGISGACRPSDLQIRRIVLCLRDVGRSSGCSSQHLSAICRSLLEEQTGCLHAGGAELEVIRTFCRLFGLASVL